ncbi:hypothetical protein CH063_06954 [Colletotrichum higginsianum]|uniref:Uncharacterized protein n=1 Tax=Colletotrichum higginsianum (strain IMI 349063) TaxID=759273 RepID=H1V4E8_COLHI|nr:hypothetical protein CH063_06954 [Colletotrichum higginsianum]
MLRSSCVRLNHDLSPKTHFSSATTQTPVQLSYQGLIHILQRVLANCLSRSLNREHTPPLSLLREFPVDRQSGMQKQSPVMQVIKRYFSFCLRPSTSCYR